jgi:GntR family transcriptional regulator, carbon starvation induced regulator
MILVSFLGNRYTIFIGTGLRFRMDETETRPLPDSLDAAPGSHRTMASSVYGRLRRDILEGTLKPGDRLPIDALRTRYGIGASPVREALNRLAAEGVVALEDQKGFRVPPISRADLLELTRTRRWINEIAVRESIARGDAAWEERMVVAYHRLSRAPRTSAEGANRVNPEWERLHRDFHTAVIAACGSQWFIDAFQTLFDRATRYRHLSISPAPERDDMAEHHAIMEAALARNAAEAIRVLNNHISLTSDIVATADGLLPDGAGGTPKRRPRS